MPIPSSIRVSLQPQKFSFDGVSNSSMVSAPRPIYPLHVSNEEAGNAYYSTCILIDGNTALSRPEWRASVSKGQVPRMTLPTLPLDRKRVSLGF